METYEQINVSTPIPIIANEKSRRPNRLRIHCGHAGVVLSRLTGLRKTTCYGTAPGHRETLGTPDHHYPGAARYQKTVWLPFVANFRISPGATAFSSAKASGACAVMLARTPWVSAQRSTLTTLVWADCSQLRRAKQAASRSQLNEVRQCS